MEIDSKILKQTLVDVACELGDGATMKRAAEVSLLKLAKQSDFAGTDEQKLVRLMETPAGIVLKRIAFDPAAGHMAPEQYAEHLKRNAVDQRHGDIVKVAATSAEAVEIMKMATEIRSKTPGLSEAQAIKRAMEQNPDIAKRAVRGSYELQRPEPAAPFTHTNAAPTSSQATDALAELRRRADAIKAKHPNISDAVAMKRAMQQNPDLYRQAQNG